MKKSFIAGALFIALQISFSSYIHAETATGSLTATPDKLTKNEQLFREDIQYRLDARLQNQVNGIINGYKLKIAKMDKASADRLTDSILAKLEKILYKMEAAQSADKSLEKKATNKYLAYMLLKFELMLLK